MKYKNIVWFINTFPLLFVLANSSVVAQIIPDNTLPKDSKVKEVGNTTVIEKGSRQGENLFHSFKELSVPSNETIYFNNELGVKNIFTRITGSSISEINGSIRANGTTNLFLINPNGINFGKNASLDIGGSFFASTASSIKFSDGFEFTANDASTPLLTISAATGLEFINNSSGAIQITGEGNQITPSFSFTPTKVDQNGGGIRVKPERTLALLGNTVKVQGGTIAVPEGNVELSSIGSGFVSLKYNLDSWDFDYEGVSNFSNVQLSKQALIDTSGIGSGKIQINGKNVKLDEGSLILIQNEGGIPSGNLTLNASDSLVLSGTSPQGNFSSAIRSEGLSTGAVGNIIISAQDIKIQDGGRIGTTTYSEGKGGNIIVYAPSSIQFLENNSVNLARKTFTVGSIAALTYGSGDAGNIQISTENLRVTNGSSISSTTVGSGNGGNLTLNTKVTEVIGIDTQTNRSSTVSAASANSGDAGFLKINTSKLLLQDGGLISTSSFNTGKTGTLIIEASDIEVSGAKNNVPSSIRASADFIGGPNQDQERLGVPPVPNSSPGEIIISTKSININQGGLVSVRNRGIKEAGKLQIDAESLKLNQGNITATTSLSEGGNIFLNLNDLQLRNSQISTTAGGNGNGGDITINGNTITALEKSSIRAKYLCKNICAFQK